MKISVIVPTFNRGYIIAEAIQSVLCQSYPHFELIIVDDGSADNTCDVLGAFLKDDRVRLIRHAKNKGVSAARNTGLSLAQGDLVSFLDSDDLWHVDKLALEVAFLTRHPQSDAVFTDLALVGDGAISSIVRTCPEFAKYLASLPRSEDVLIPQRIMYLCMLEEMPARIQATTMRRKAVTEIDGFREGWPSGEDWEFLLRFVRNHGIGFIDVPLVTRRLMPDSTLGQNQKADAFLLVGLFIAEKQLVDGDREAEAAINRTISSHSDRLGHRYLMEGQLLAALNAYLAGFWQSHDFRLLAKALAIPIPLTARNQIKSLIYNFRSHA